MKLSSALRWFHKLSKNYPGDELSGHLMHILVGDKTHSCFSTEAANASEASNPSQNEPPQKGRDKEIPRT